MRRGLTTPFGNGVRHFPAGLGAGAASFGAFLAMVESMLGALGAAGIADFGAERADLGGELGAARHLARGEGADVGATAIKFDAMGHHVDVGLAEAGGGAALAGVSASMAGLNAVVEGKVVHGGARGGLSAPARTDQTGAAVRRGDEVQFFQLGSF